MRIFLDINLFFLLSSCCFLLLSQGEIFPRVAPRRFDEHSPWMFFFNHQNFVVCFPLLLVSQSQFITKINLSPIHYSPSNRARDSQANASRNSRYGLDECRRIVSCARFMSHSELRIMTSGRHVCMLNWVVWCNRQVASCFWILSKHRCIEWWLWQMVWTSGAARWNIQ